MQHSDLKVHQLLLGPMENYCYIIADKASKKCMVIDPAWDIKTITDTIEQNEYQLTSIIISHYHPDHCGGHLWGHDIEGVSELLKKFDVPVLCHSQEKDGILTITKIAPSGIQTIESGEDYQLGNQKLKFIHTPGHTPGSVCLLWNNCLFAGDTLFINGCGRVDLPGGNVDQLHDSLTNKLMKLDPQTVLYPGHAYAPQKSVTFQELLTLNPYLQNITNKTSWMKNFG